MNQKNTSLLLDIGQIISLILLVSSGYAIPNNFISILLLLIACVLMAWGVWEMRMNRFYQVPDIKKQQKLITSGPYRFIRNPMYASQLLIGTSIVLNKPFFNNLVFLLFLLYIFVQKMNYEEKLLEDHFKDEFIKYKQTSRRLVPFIY